jgi:hypothetical protein
MNSSKILKSIGPFLLFILLIACASKQPVIINGPEIEEHPKLLFINYMISKTAEGEKNIKLINQIITDGNLKKLNKTSDEKSFGDLECTTLDKDLNQIGTHLIKNPLKKIIEYINDLGNFEKKILDLDSAQFSIRLQLQTNVKYIKISELTKTGLKEHITTELE